MSNVIRSSLNKIRETLKSNKYLKIVFGTNRNMFVFVIAIGLVGAYLLVRSFAHAEYWGNSDWWAPRVRACESGSLVYGSADYQAYNRSSTASGAYQYLKSTWNNYAGYSEARYAPEHIQDRRFAEDWNDPELGSNPWLASKHCWKPYGTIRNAPSHDPPPNGGNAAPPSTPPPDRPSPTPSANGNPFPCSHPTIRRGSRGECVQHLQWYLEKLGYDLGGFGADGDFGNATRNAVVSFQSNNGLAADGIVGPQTWGGLHNAIESGTGGPSLPSLSAPRVNPVCRGTSSVIDISWTNPGYNNIHQYTVDVDDDNFAGGWWNRHVGLATSTTAPDGFNFGPTAGPALNFSAGRTYYVRVYFAGPDIHTPTERVIAQNCSSGGVTSNAVASGVDTLNAGQVLLRGRFMRSQNGKYELHLQQSDGHLVLYNLHNGRAIWANHVTNGARLEMQIDGNLVVYKDNNGYVNPLWDSATWDTAGRKLLVQNDGNMVIYTPSWQPIWATNTWGM